ncbi:MAG: sulfate ABC transporter substrate-binding protein [Chitinispirillaceae bacterium]|nr:sulfate ABC transporter substrate-binding protein [Chitinispirillaceae bacterium]
MLILSVYLFANARTIELLNVSYDPTREFYKEFNGEFIKYWEKKTGDKIVLNQSHGGAGKQARAVIDGLKADVVTLALAYDIDAIAEKTGLLPANWQTRLPNNSSPYTSTIVFLVRKGNPKKIRDWDDIVKPGIEVITPNPKTSGGARWNHLAAWGYVLKKELGDLSKLKSIDLAKRETVEKNAYEFLGKLYKNVPVLDAGARGATNTFVQRGIGDVLLAWENEAFLSINELGSNKFEIVVPSVSILAEPPVTVVDKNAEAKGVVDVAGEYLNYLYSPVGQRLAAKHYYRPVHSEHADPVDVKRFPDVYRFSVDEVFGGWKKAQKNHFDDNGIFDRIYTK